MVFIPYVEKMHGTKSLKFIIFCCVVTVCLIFLLYLLLRSCLLGSSCQGHVVTVTIMMAYSIVSLFGHSCLLHLTLSPIYSDHSMLSRDDQSVDAVYGSNGSLL